MQSYDSTQPIEGTKFASLYAILRNHFETLRSSFSGTSFPVSPVPVEGQPFFLTTTHFWYIYSNSGWREVVKDDTGIGLEIVNARGSKTSLDARLDVALNDDGTLRATPSLNPSQWVDPSFTCTYISSTSFTILTNQTDIYLRDRRLKFTLSTGHVFSEVISSSYSVGTGLTTIIIREGVLTNTLSKVEHSIISPRKDYLGDGALNYKSVGAHQIIVELKTDSYNVTVDDFGKCFVMNPAIPAGAKSFNMPSVGSGEVGGWIEFIKLSGELRIDPADNDVIEDGGLGDYIYSLSGENIASLKLKLVTESLYEIESGVGTWVTTD
jgi:hypothetical protein